MQPRPTSIAYDDHEKKKKEKEKKEKRNKVCLKCHKLGNLTCVLLMFVLLFLVIGSIAKYHQTYNDLIFNTILNDREQRSENSTIITELEQTSENEDLSNVLTTEHTTASPEQTTKGIDDPLNVLTTEHTTASPESTTKSQTTSAFFRTTQSKIHEKTTREFTTLSLQTTFQFYFPENCNNLENCLGKCARSNLDCDSFCEIKSSVCKEECNESYCNEICDNEHGSCHIACGDKNLDCKIKCYNLCQR